MSKKDIAYNIKVGQSLVGIDPKSKKTGKYRVINRIVKNQDRDVELTVIQPDGSKKLLRYYWTEEVELWSPPSKRRRKAFLIWLSKKLRCPVKFT